MKNFDDFRIEIEKDAEYQALLKRIKETELNPLKYGGEIRQIKAYILRYSENGDAHMAQLIETTKNMELQLARFRITAYSHVYSGLDNAYASLFGELLETVKSYARAGNLAYAFLINAEIALLTGSEKGWAEYTEEILIQEIQKIESDLKSLKERLPEKIRGKI